MKLLILMFSSLNSPYPDLIRAACETWNREEHPNISTIFFHGNEGDLENSNIKTIYKAPASDAYNMQHVKYKKTLDYVWGQDWDFVLRGSLSSYFDKTLVYEKALTLPKDKVYLGVKNQYMKDVSSELVYFASGCGHFQSRDVADILRKELPETSYHHEDVLQAEILLKYGIEVTSGAERYDFNSGDALRSCYHYRCKGETKEETIGNFKKVYSFLKEHREFLDKD